ncbi:MAG: hypothetical protein JXA21_30425 [Anaerolineae bacterium]|nr:hypothetical protein [Anaerolineae bacterium]
MGSKAGVGGADNSAIGEVEVKIAVGVGIGTESETVVAVNKEGEESGDMLAASPTPVN